MAFPTNLISLANAVGTNFLSVLFGGSVSHSAGLNIIIADLLGVEQKIGLGASTPIANRILGGTGTGTSAWRQVTTDDLAADCITLAGSSDGTISNPAQNSTSYATLQGDGPSSELAVVLVLAKTGDIEATLVASAQESVFGDVFLIAFSLNGAAEVREVQGTTSANNIPIQLKTHKIWYDQPAGTYTIRGRYRVNAGTWIGTATKRQLDARAYYR